MPLCIMVREIANTRNIWKMQTAQSRECNEVIGVEHYAENGPKIKRNDDDTGSVSVSF